ncbi:IgGFc-binding protein-like [Phasianus colchicus]|uniref:IgGFc-binding protein-like n=1 Tax=Phasianus colchicus TaxID=9054 RepID=UPI00129E8115|nr:IgGFc-binding protein-like [Phasianus colchicus]
MCKTEDGQAKCVPSLVASCWAWGDPHYRTFDRLDFDFEGTCTYTMAEFCGNDPKLVPFKVQGKNRIRGEVKSISYISLANIEVYGHRISIHWREVGKVRVDGVLTLLPVTLQDDRVLIFQSGMTAVLQTDFGLRVTYDWNWHLIVDLPSSYSEQTCGLCGNFNLEPGDDIPMQAGNLTSSIISWASNWKVPDEDPFCWDFCNGECPVCEEEKQELYSGNQHCGLIKKSFQGPFKACHDVVNPRDFFRNCLYDVCMSDGAKKILCKTLETYASTCRKHGAVVHNWRTPSGCCERWGFAASAVGFCCFCCGVLQNWGGSGSRGDACKALSGTNSSGCVQKNAPCFCMRVCSSGVLLAKCSVCFAWGLLSVHGSLHAKHSVCVCTAHLRGVKSVFRVQRAAWVCMAQYPSLRCCKQSAVCICNVPGADIAM